MRIGRKNWWEAPDLPRPCYVGLHKKRTKSLIALALSLIALVIAELLQFIPYGTTILFAFIVGLIQFIASFMGHPSISRNDEIFLENMLRISKDLISRYSVPSARIPLAIQYINGVQLYAAYTSGQLNVFVLKPKTFYKIMRKKKPLFRYKFVKKYKIGKIFFGEANVTAPHIELRNTIIKTRANMVRFLPHREISSILEWIRDFDKRYSEAINYALHTSNRRRSYTRQSRQNTRQAERDHRGGKTLGYRRIHW